MVVPENVFAPERVTVPEVSFVSPTAPARMAEMVPLWTVNPEVLVSAEVPLPRMEPLASVTAPTLSVWLAPMSSVPPFTFTLPVPSALLAPYASVPAETSVAPEKEFAALLSRMMPAPVFVMPPAPDTMPVKFTSPPVSSVSVTSVPSATVPLSAFTPVVFSPPIVRSPVLPTGTLSAFATVRPAVAEKRRLAGEVLTASASPTVIVAVPPAVFESRTSVPF